MAKSKEEKEREAQMKEEKKRVLRVMDEVSKHLQSETKTNEGKTKEKTISYFSGAAIVDVLLNSKWTEENDDLYIQTREEAVEFCTGLLAQEYFIALREKKKKGTETDNNDIKDKERKKKKKNLKFEVINDVDAFYDLPAQYYMWKYSPMGKWAWIIGGAVLLGVVAMALVPVWPSEAQIVFQYLTTGSGLFLGFLIALLIVRAVAFLVVWGCSKGVYHFWLLPNINDDRLGVIETFKPLYSISNYYEEKEKKERRRKRRELRELGQVSESDVPSGVEDKKTV